MKKKTIKKLVMDLRLSPMSSKRMIKALRHLYKFDMTDAEQREASGYNVLGGRGSLIVEMIKTDLVKYGVIKLDLIKDYLDKYYTGDLKDIYADDFKLVPQIAGCIRDWTQATGVHFDKPNVEALFLFKEAMVNKEILRCIRNGIKPPVSEKTIREMYARGFVNGN